MNLREKLNESKLGECLNISNLGRWFDRTDFALTVEDSLSYFFDNKRSFGERFVPFLFFPFLVSVVYIRYKMERIKNSERYEYQKELFSPSYRRDKIVSFWEECIDDYSGGIYV